MSEYIDREEIEYENWQGVCWANPIAVVRKCSIDSMPAADVAPVVHGKWEYRNSSWYCSNCGRGYRVKCGVVPASTHNYCPNCGARMDGADND